MRTSISLTRREAILASGVATAGLLLGVRRLPAFAASGDGPALPIPRLIEARSDRPVVLAMAASRHDFGRGQAASAGISASYLGPVVRVQSGDTVPFQVENRLSEDTTLHWHGLLVPSAVDGGPHNTIAAGATWSPELKIAQGPATTWFHPHPHGRTARQVYSGLAGMMIVSDQGDRDRGLPADYGVDDLPIVLQDKRFDRSGTPVYRPSMMELMDGFQGDTLLVNGAIAPVAAVPAGMVRLRVLNAANARNFDLRFADRRPFHVVANDGGYLGEPVEVRRLVVAPGERYEVLVDFAGGAAVALVTDADTQHGSSGMGMMMMGPAVAGTMVRFVPNDRIAAKVTRLPQKLGALPQADTGAVAARRSFVLDPMAMGGMMGGMGGGGMAGMGGDGMGGMRTINGRSFDMKRIDATAKLGTSEVWEISAPQMNHPFHVHGASFRVISIDGRKPPAEQAGLKDVVLVQNKAEILLRFEKPAPAAMPYMFHCHILEHEDQGMMGQLAVV